MLSRRLWHALNTPYTRHPLFWRTVKRGGGSQFYHPNYQLNGIIRRAFYTYLSAVAVMTVILNLTNSQMQQGFLGAMALVLLFPIALIVGFVLRYTVFKATLNGIQWVINISLLIAEQHEGRRTSLLATTPPGILGASWAIGSGYLYRNRSLLRYIHQREVILRFMALATAIYVIFQPYPRREEVSLTLIYLFVCVGLYGVYYGVTTDILRYQVPSLAYKIGTLACIVVLLAVAIVASRNYATQGESLYLIIHGLVFMAAFYIDSLHTPVVAALIGVLSARYVRRKADARIWALGFFLTAQAGVFLCTLLCAFFILPVLYAQLGIHQTWAASVSIPIISVIVFYLVREGLIAILWMLLKHSLNIGQEEMGIFANQLV